MLATALGAPDRAREWRRPRRASNESSTNIYVGRLVPAPSEQYNAERDRRAQRQREICASIAARMSELARDVREDGGQINATSRNDFSKFVAEYPLAFKPYIGVLENGNVRALWRGEVGDQVGLQFLGDELVQFVAIPADRRLHASGRAPLHRLRAELTFGRARNLVFA